MNVYVQSTGAFYDGNGDFLWRGYSGGNRGNDPEGVNNPELQDVPCVGPLPVGLYRIGEPHDHPTCGRYFIPLTPHPDNHMFGRGGFGIHGDLITAVGQQRASDGCIILPLSVREKIGAGSDLDLQVVATRPLATENSGAGGGINCS